MKDLWPDDIKATGIKPPVTILKEQATLLGEKTNNIVTASVLRSESRNLLSPVFGKDFSYTFFIEAPALGGYRYALFSIGHSIEIYPVYFDLDESIKKEFIGPIDKEVSVDSEEEFLDILQGIFNSDKTKKVIGSILSQSS